MTRPIDLVLARLPDAKPSGRDRWRSACPACGGNTSALSVGIGNDEAVLIRCWKGCDAATVAGALGLQLHDLFPQQLTGSPRLRRRSLLTAGQCLDVVSFECLLVSTAAFNLANGHALTMNDLERLSIAVGRIQALAAEVRA